jgi:Zn-dependent protease
MDFLYKATLVLVPMILSLSVHEYAHARSAYALGDDTAASMGRMNLNPLSHIDPFGTIMLPLIAILSGTGFFFGWARPVPINPVRFTRRFTMKTGILLTAAAGPASNLVFAFVIALIWKILAVAGLVDIPFWQVLSGYTTSPIHALVRMTFLINIVLAIFNMIPIPPLDGSRVLSGLLPDHLGRRYAYLERNPMFVMLAFAVIIFGAGRFLAWPVGMIARGILTITGNT